MEISRGGRVYPSVTNDRCGNLIMKTCRWITLEADGFTAASREAS